LIHGLAACVCQNWQARGLAASSAARAASSAALAQSLRHARLAAVSAVTPAGESESKRPQRDWNLNLSDAWRSASLRKPSCDWMSASIAAFSSGSRSRSSA
jgi:hypothetical protein